MGDLIEQYAFSMAGTLVFRVVGLSEVRVLRFNLQFIKIADLQGWLL